VSDLRGRTRETLEGETMAVRRFEHRQAGHFKFWEIEVQLSRDYNHPMGEWVLWRHWGRIGATAGQQKRERYRTEAQANSVMAMLIGDKLAKGYREIGGTYKITPAPEPTPDLSMAAGPEDEGGPDGDFLRRLRKKVAAQYGKG